MNQFWTVAATIILLSSQASSALAQPRLPHSPTDQEMLMLPQECKIFLRGSAEQKNLLNNRVPGLVGPNHYCWGLNFLNRAKFSSLNKSEKRFNLQSAIDEFGYVLSHSAPDAVGIQQVKTQDEQAKLMLRTL